MTLLSEKGTAVRKKRIALIYGPLLHYRIALFNKLAEYYDLTVIHPGQPSLKSPVKFKQVIAPAYTGGPFSIQPTLFRHIRKNEFDHVILFFDVRWITTLLALIILRKEKVILWGPWLTRSRIANVVRRVCINRVAATVLYSKHFLNQFCAAGCDPHRMYVAHNSIDVAVAAPAFENCTKDRILCVGSVVARKRYDQLLDAFSNIVNRIPSSIKIVFVGSGDACEQLITYAHELGIDERVEFRGEVIRPQELAIEYSRAIVSVSVGQAGLSILQSMGHGVPYLTTRSAISGGEALNIVHGQTGLLCDNTTISLANQLEHICNDIDYARNLGKNAYSHYQCYCTIENMAKGFVDAIEKTRSAKVFSG